MNEQVEHTGKMGKWDYVAIVVIFTLGLVLLYVSINALPGSVGA